MWIGFAAAIIIAAAAGIILEISSGQFANGTSTSSTRL
jgi:hypothetical protein